MYGVYKVKQGWSFPVMAPVWPTYIPVGFPEYMKQTPTGNLYKDKGIGANFRKFLAISLTQN